MSTKLERDAKEAEARELIDKALQALMEQLFRLSGRVRPEIPASWAAYLTAQASRVAKKAPHADLRGAPPKQVPKRAKAIWEILKSVERLDPESWDFERQKKLHAGRVARLAKKLNLNKRTLTRDLKAYRAGLELPAAERTSAQQRLFDEVADAAFRDRGPRTPVLELKGKAKEAADREIQLALTESNRHLQEYFAKLKSPPTKK